MDLKEKILFWRDEANRSLAVASDLFKSKRYLESLFFGHLALEKLLKSKIIEQNKQEPVYSHDLIILAKYAQLILKKDERDFLTRINTYNIRTRYQDYKMTLYKTANYEYTKSELAQIRLFFNKIQ